MPEPLHPPYGVGSVPPRQLNRWLDVNSQNGPLTRTRGYISLPAFNIASAGRTYSEIVGVFNYSASNNFSLQNFKSITNDGSYTLCIAYANADLTVKRYVLVKGTSDNNLSYPPTYNGEKIKKNFRLEVWDGTAHTTCSNLTEIKIFSTVLGGLDYRYGTDFVLGTAATLCTSQNVTNQVQTAFAPPQTSLEIWLRADSDYLTLDGSGNVNTWQDRSHNVVQYTQATAGNRPKFISLGTGDHGQYGYLQFLGEKSLGSGLVNGFSIVELFVLLTPNVGGVNDNPILRIFNAIPNSIIFDSVNISGVFRVNFVSGAGLVTALYAINPQNNFYSLVNIDTSINGITVSDGRTGVVKNIPGFLGNYVITPPLTIIIGNDSVVNALGYNIGAILGYSAHISAADRALVYQYLAEITDGGISFTAPLSFSPCTVLTPN